SPLLFPVKVETDGPGVQWRALSGLVFPEEPGHHPLREPCVRMDSIASLRFWSMRAPRSHSEDGPRLEPETCRLRATWFRCGRSPLRRPSMYRRGGDGPAQEGRLVAARRTPDASPPRPCSR